MLTISKRVVVSLALAAAETQACAQPPAIGMPSVTICELAKDFSKYEGRRVVLRAVLVTDRRHGTPLVDKQCPGFYLNIKRLETADPSVAAFYAEMNKDMLDLSLRVFAIKVEGRIVRNEFSIPQHMNPPLGTVELDRVLFFARHPGDSNTAVAPPA
jgi:hypothetical protein